MNILFISGYGDTLGLAQRVDLEGHNAFFYIWDSKHKGMGEGIVQKTRTTQSIASKEGKINKGVVNLLLKECDPQLVVVDMVHLGEVADYVKSLHVPVMGGSKWADFAELDRTYGYKLMKMCGIKTPPTLAYTAGQREEAIKMVTKSGKRYVYKPSGNLSTSHTYVSKGPEDMVVMLQLWKSDKGEFELQEFIDGVEVSCELWWDGMTAQLHNWTMEEKKFMNDRLGPSIGCAGNVVQSVSPKSRLVREGIGKVEKLLKKTDYRGPIDLNTIANKEGLWGLEFTVRFGYDALQAMIEIRRGTVVGLLHGIATGSPTVGTLTADFSIGVRVTIPPYPNEEAKAVAGIPIIGVNDKNSKYIWLSDVVAGGDRYESAGCDGNLLTVTARGQTVRECRRRVYRTINNLTIPHLQYRTDIGERVDDDLTKLKEWNYL